MCETPRRALHCVPPPSITDLANRHVSISVDVCAGVSVSESIQHDGTRQVHIAGPVRALAEVLGVLHRGARGMYQEDRVNALDRTRRPL